MATLIARLGCAQVALAGTSMGGLIGLLLAAQPGTPLRPLAMHDVGPSIPQAAPPPLPDHVRTAPRFPDLTAAEAYHRKGSRGLGAFSIAQRPHLPETPTPP